MQHDFDTILKTVTAPDAKMGDLRAVAKEIRTDHELAMKLWNEGSVMPRLLATLVMDKKKIDQEFVDQITKDLESHTYDEMNHIADWFMANQLAKDKKTVALMESWENSESSLQRRLFWYHQARLRWMGKTDQPNTEELLEAVENNIMQEKPEVQWAMNFTAAQIGKWQEKYRQRCIELGEKTGLYKGEKVPKGCTPSYLPDFIAIETTKLKK